MELNLCAACGAFVNRDWTVCQACNSELVIQAPPLGAEQETPAQPQDQYPQAHEPAQPEEALDQSQTVGQEVVAQDSELLEADISEGEDDFEAESEDEWGSTSSPDADSLDNEPVDLAGRLSFPSIQANSVPAALMSPEDSPVEEGPAEAEYSESLIAHADESTDFGSHINDVHRPAEFTAAEAAFGEADTEMTNEGPAFESLTFFDRDDPNVQGLLRPDAEARQPQPDVAMSEPFLGQFTTDQFTEVSFNDGQTEQAEQMVTGQLNQAAQFAPSQASAPQVSEQQASEHWPSEQAFSQQQTAEQPRTSHSFTNEATSTQTAAGTFVDNQSAAEQFSTTQSLNTNASPGIGEVGNNTPSNTESFNNLNFPRWEPSTPSEGHPDGFDVTLGALNSEFPDYTSVSSMIIGPPEKSPGIIEKLKAHVDPSVLEKSGKFVIIGIAGVAFLGLLAFGASQLFTDPNELSHSTNPTDSTAPVDNGGWVEFNDPDNLYTALLPPSTVARIEPAATTVRADVPERGIYVETYIRRIPENRKKELDPQLMANQLAETARDRGSRVTSQVSEQGNHGYQIKGHFASGDRKTNGDAVFFVKNNVLYGMWIVGPDATGDPELYSRLINNFRPK